jgi:hypothetical protein
LHRSVEIDLSEVLITDFIQLPTSVGATGPKVFRVTRNKWSCRTARNSGTVGSYGVHREYNMGPQGIQGVAGNNRWTLQIILQIQGTDLTLL